MALAWKERDDGAPRVAFANRYELRGVIGGGRTGIVHRAYDRRLGRVIALKTLRAQGPEALYRLKREFRTLARLAHRNLVSFFDLVVEGEERFFTMELVDGVEFVEAFRARLANGEPPATVHRDLRAAIVQLAAGLDALHRQGILHRDVKPANVLIAGDGRLVLLDFGLALEVAAHEEEDGGTAGTMGYLAPEQITGRGASVASDWFGAGVMLYETLTGRLPFEGATLLDALSGRARRPTPPRVLEPTTPEDLDALVLALLELDPVRRPVGNDVVARLTRPAARPAPAELDPVGRHGPLVGRDAELAELRAALDESRTAWVTLQLVGPSGIGKTALAEEFVARAAAERGALILEARCHPQEAIPFKALDGAVDALTKHLGQLGDHAVKQLLPDDIASVRRIFPVLGRVPRIARAVAHGGADVDPAKGRREAFRALRALLSRIADGRPVVLWIDDAQWGDLDSAALLRELRRAPDPPRVLLLLSFCQGLESTGSMIGALRASPLGQVGPVRDRTLEIGPLARDAASVLVRTVLGVSAPGTAERIADESQGSPLFAIELARDLAEQRGGAPVAAAAGGAPAPSVDAVVAARIERLPAAAREVLDLLALAGRPLDRDLVRRAAAADTDLRPALALLHAERLARAVPAGENVADAVYHERIRASVLQLLPRDRQRALHLALAGSLGAEGDADPRLLVHHYEQAGDAGRAAELALASGRRAAADLAFHQAAELYARALELGTTAVPVWVLQARIGRMLAFAGRASEAAASYAAAADALHDAQPSDPRRVSLRRRAAELYLRAGRYEEGLAALRSSLRDSGVRYPRTSATAVLFILARRLQLDLMRRFRDGRVARPLPTPAERELLEVYWSAGVGLSLFDMVRAADFQLRHALLALRLDEPRHRARALATEAMTLVWEGGARKRRRSEASVGEAARIATAMGDPRIEIQTLITRAAVVFADRRFREVMSLCERGTRLGNARHVGTTWEMANLELCAVSTLACMGELARARVRLVELQQRAHDRGDLYSIVSLRIGFPNLCWLAADDPDEARRQVAEARAAATLAPFQDYCAVFAEAQIDLYAGRAERGWALARAAWPRFRRRFLLRIQAVRVDLLEIRARCALALAASGDRRRRSMLRFVRWAAWRITRERVAWAMPAVTALRAGIAWQDGDRTSAIAGLADAAAGFDRLDMRMHAAAARLHLARLGVGEPVARCADVMRGLGAVHPGRLAAALLPGFPDLDDMLRTR